MYFNLDREKKQKILDYYKKDLLDFERRKKEAKQAKIQEELKLLHQNELKEKESEEKMIEEEKRKKKALMDEYLDMLHKTKILEGGYHYKPKNREIINKNWGKSKEDFLKENKKDKFYTIDYHRPSDSDIFNSMSEKEKIKQILKPVDCMNKFITDAPNEKKVNSYFLEQKQNKQDLYRKILYKQHNDYIQNNLKMYGTDDVLILKQKKKNLVTGNPYNKYDYRIGNSYLERNPILNPENNMTYNKYFKELHPNSTGKKDKIQLGYNTNENNNLNNNNINNIYHRINSNDSNNNNIFGKVGSNNMALNGSNIINDFNYYQNNSLNRNLSYNNQNNRIFNFNNNNNNDLIINGYSHKYLNNSGRSMSLA